MMEFYFFGLITNSNTFACYVIVVFYFINTMRGLRCYTFLLLESLGGETKLMLNYFSFFEEELMLNHFCWRSKRNM